MIIKYRKFFAPKSKGNKGYQEVAVFNVVYRILIYFKGTPEKGNEGYLEVAVFVDADWAGNHRSTLPSYNFVGDNLVILRSKKENVTEGRAEEALELIRVLAHDICEVLELRVCGP